MQVVICKIIIIPIVLLALHSLFVHAIPIFLLSYINPIVILINIYSIGH